MPSDLNQKLFLGKLPEGLKFTITEVTPWAEGGGTFGQWGAVFYTANGVSLSNYGGKVYGHLDLPLEVDVSKDVVKLGGTKLVAQNGVYVSGQGGKIDIKYHIEGTTMVDGESIEICGDGFISVSASDWGGFARPDYSNVTYTWAGEPPVNASLGVPSTIAGMPDDIYIVFAINPKENKLGVTTTTHRDLVSTIIDYALKGVFWANSKLFGWAIGKFM
ncbi:hypothetical protein D9758_001530 [Tetrapyrgos nigripes]|uniref:Uncharacterized protein n=1 Tax=Tetrapyrgos nigripes TaxID=182062 RepID=A0A8H5LXD2_9AGAR|nr:hypothetical protein D9758_001530 [Tetrapyrgos nigripes]